MSPKKFETPQPNVDYSRQDPSQDTTIAKHHQKYFSHSRTFYESSGLSALANILLIFVLTTFLYIVVGAVFFVIIKIFSLETFEVNWIIASLGSLYVLTIISFIFIGHNMKSGMESRSLKEVFRRISQQKQNIHTPYI